MNGISQKTNKYIWKNRKKLKSERWGRFIGYFATWLAFVLPTWQICTETVAGSVGVISCYHEFWTPAIGWRDTGGREGYGREWREIDLWLSLLEDLRTSGLLYILVPSSLSLISFPIVLSTESPTTTTTITTIIATIIHSRTYAHMQVVFFCRFAVTEPGVRCPDTLAGCTKLLIFYN